MQEHTIKFPVSIKSCETSACCAPVHGKHVIPCRVVALVAGYSVCQPHPPRDWAYILRGIGRGRKPLAIDLRLGALFFTHSESAAERVTATNSRGRASPLGGPRDPHPHSGRATRLARRMTWL